jgi:DNA-binding NtrC family response regulator
MPTNADREVISGLKIMLVEPDRAIAAAMADIITRHGGEFLALESYAQGSLHFSHYHPDIGVCSAELPDGSGIELMKEWKMENPSIPVILLSTQTKLESALTALRGGAFDYLTKTCAEAQIVMTLKRASEISRLREKVNRMQGRERPIETQTIVGTSRVTRSLVASIKKIAKSKCDSCMLLGESGVGKELAAHLLHDFSSRAKEPFIEINAASIPENLLESELFGHERGAYTDAKERKAGLFEIASNGTVFLDEIGEMPLNLQAKLLRVMESRRFKRLGGVKDIELKARIVVATNRDLAAHVVAGRFRADLFYRLNVIPIRIPPLRERKGDIAGLAAFFAESLAEQLAVAMPIIPEETIAFLEKHPWPGNIRELRNAIYRALVMFEPEVLLIKHIALENLDILPAQESAISGKVLEHASEKPIKAEKSLNHIVELPEDGIPLDQVEESLLLQALERCRHNQTKAAHMLGISRHALRYRLEKHGLT